MQTYILEIILSCWNFTLLFTRNRKNYERKWVWKKRRALCHYRNTTVYSCIFYILTKALVLVCRYFLDTQYQVLNTMFLAIKIKDKNSCQLLYDKWLAGDVHGVQGLTWGAQGVTMKDRRCSCGEGYFETMVKWQPVSNVSIMAWKLL